MDTKWVVLGAVASVSVGLLAYALSKDREKRRKSPPRLRRDEVVSILKDLLKDSTPILISIAGCSLSGGRLQQGEMCRRYTDERQLDQAFAQVYKRYRVSEGTFRRCYELYREDPEVRSLSDSLASGLQHARNGIAPATTGFIPDSLTPERVLQLFRIVYWTSAANTLEQLDSLRSQGISFSPFDARFQQVATALEAESSALKSRLLLSLRIPPSSDSVLREAVEIYAQRPAFLREYNDLEEEYRAVMLQIALQRVTEDERRRVQERRALAVELIDRLAA